METVGSASSDFPTLFAQQRQRLLRHASTLIGPDSAVTSDPDAVPKLSQTVLAALEVLKVAEEELLDDRRRAAKSLLAHERRIAELELLFNEAPTALILTSADTTIRESNKAGGVLLTRDPHMIEGKQLMTMVSRPQQALFREQLARVIEIGGVRSWSFTLDRQADVPVTVTASVEVIADGNVGTRALYWNIRPESTDPRP